MAWRDSRAQRARLAIFFLSLATALATLAALQALRHSAAAAIDGQARTLLGSDLQVTSRQPFTAVQISQLVPAGARAARETAFTSMLASTRDGQARLVQVRAFEPGYPFYGAIESRPPGAAAALAQGGGILLEESHLAATGLQPGDTVRLGERDFRILGTIAKPAPRLARFGGFAPEAYLLQSDLPATGLLEKTRLASHSLHLALVDPSSAPRLKEDLSARHRGEGWRWETADDRRDQLGRALDRFEEFLGLLALSGLVLGALGVAGAMHSHLARRLAPVAVLRCLGCPGSAAMAVFTAQTLALGGLAALGGAFAGGLLHAVAVWWFGTALPVRIPVWPAWPPLAAAALAGLVFCLAAALLPLLRVRDIPPAMVLRGTTGPLLPRRHRWVPGLVLATALAAALFLLDPAAQPVRTAAHAGGLALAFLLLAATARLLMAASRRVLRPSWPYPLRQGVANLYRPRNQTLLFLLSLGLGTFLLLTLLLTRDLLFQRLESVVDPGNPNLYLVDVQADQVSGVQDLLAGQGLTLLESAPMVTMRIAAVEGVPVRQLQQSGRVPRWILEREFRSTYRSNLVPTETVVAGAWPVPTAAPGEPVPLSLEEKLAGDLGIGLGDTVTLDVQGLEIPARVAALRRVDWSRFNLNFFMVFGPGVLEEAPGFHVLTTRTPDGAASGRLQSALAAGFPNVSAIDLSLVLQTVRSILDSIAAVVQVLLVFSLATGLLIITGTLLNGRDQRVAETILLRTLGASSRQVQRILLVEYATLGLLAGACGVLLAVGAHAVLARFVFDAAPWPPWTPVLGALAGGILLAVAAGLTVGRGICRQPPLQILRGL